MIENAPVSGTMDLDEFDMPEFSLRCSVGDLYRGTPLDPRRT
jgi:hypothetical protein